MNKRILLGIDLSITPATHYAMRAASELLTHSSSQMHLVLLCVIPTPTVASPSASMYVGHLMPLAVTTEQRSMAEDILYQARLALQQDGIAPERIEILLRIGLPADEIIKAARELQASFIIVGSRGNALRQRIRRFFMSSISQRVLPLARS